MSRVAELYSEEGDRSAREQGLVYVEDLAVSGLMIALKANCAPQGLGFLHAQPIAPEEVGVLHSDLVDGISAVNKRRFFFFGRAAQRATRCNNNPDVSITRNLDGKVELYADYWDGRPFRTKLVAGEKLDPELLTGFEPFNPRGFDSDQGEGVAQRVVDDLRASGDPMSPEVLRNEEGRIFERAREAETMFGPGTDPELYVALQKSLARVRGLAGH